MSAHGPMTASSPKRWTVFESVSGVRAMTSSLRQPWNAAFENYLFNAIIAAHAPHLPKEPPTETRPPETEREISEVVEFTARLAAHDTFIVQACSRAIAALDFDTDFQLKLARQIGDDGRHAVEARERLVTLTGRDQTACIDGYVRELWTALGDIPYRDIFGFLAFQFHYELHIQGRLKAEGRTAKIRYGRNRKKQAAPAAHNEADDELVHRVNIVGWVDALYDTVPAADREAWIAQLLAADDDMQRRLNPYLRHRISNAGRAWPSDLRNVVTIYDQFRRDVLAYLVRKAPDDLPSLTSLAA
jgi:hypothetical protein